MKVIEEKYKFAQSIVKVLKEMKSKGKKINLSMETFHVIIPTNKLGTAITKDLDSFLRRLEERTAIVISEFGRVISIEELEDRINLSMSISKKNIQDMIVKYDLKKLDNKHGIVEKLKTDSLPH